MVIKMGLNIEQFMALFKGGMVNPYVWVFILLGALIGGLIIMILIHLKSEGAIK